MSVGFQIFKSSKGWRISTDSHVDLTHWDLDYRRDCILCRPRGMEFIYMALGAAFFLALAIFFLLAAINPGRLAESAQLKWRSTVNSAPIAPLAQSKYQQPRATPEEIREQTERLKERITRDMTPEERENFERRLREQQQERNRRTNDSNQRIERVTTIISWIGRVFAALGAIFFGMLGGVLCLPRALMFFRDRITISIADRSLVVTRPKLFGGRRQRLTPIAQLGSISMHSVYHRRRGRHSRAYVAWLVTLSTRDPAVFSLRFELDHLDESASQDSPPYRVRQFSEALHALTGLPIAG